ncbi:hypothetical protein [Amycolatopsis sp. NPDC059657]|uniref:hypothetical protein n=1 Tax=Amycolatopsis sp. NPDC059657 TaxID=3346899 RepID=UPI00367270C7
MRSTRLRRPVAPPEGSDEDPGLSRAVKLVGSFVANTTLLTALVFYFGFVYTQQYFGYFRVHYTLLNQTTPEILARGVDGLFMPLSVVTGALLIVLCVIRYVRKRLTADAWSKVLRVSTPLAALAGLALLGAAGFVALDPSHRSLGIPGLPGLAFAVGVLLLIFAWHRVIAGTNVVEGAIAILLITIGLFWAVGEYSVALGRYQGWWEETVRLPTAPDALVYSAKSLNLSTRGVHEVVCKQPDAAYRYRYDGLKLLLQSGGQLVLLPARWTAESGPAIVLPRTDSIRLEFVTTSAGSC